jgi:hypothetical protein
LRRLSIRRTSRPACARQHVIVTTTQSQVPTFFMRRYRICLRSASAPSVSVSDTLYCLPIALFSAPTGSRANCTRGARSPPWLLLFLMFFRPFFSPPVCSRVLLPENMVSERRDMESECTPCATTVMADLTGGRENVGSVVRRGGCRS